MFYKIDENIVESNIKSLFAACCVGGNKMIFDKLLGSRGLKLGLCNALVCGHNELADRLIDILGPSILDDNKVKLAICA